MSRHHIVLGEGADLTGFRNAVRWLIAADAPPEDVIWRTCETAELFDSTAIGHAPPVPLPPAARDLIETVVCHRDAERYALLYALVWRLRHGERELLEVASDPLVHRLNVMRKAVEHDRHRMTAFVRFRRADSTDSNERFVAWFEPDHYILESVAPFFVERFANLTWSILTPIGSLHWDGARLEVGPPGQRSDLPAGDGFEAGWQGYYESTFNPARVNPKLMRAHMPTRYWRNMPETVAVPGLIQSAPSRAQAMIEREVAVPMKRSPEKALAALKQQEPKSLEELNRIIAASEPLVPGATRAVLGEGPLGASIAFVGEQPGDQEDLEGCPFVGPAGQLFDRALVEAGLDRNDAYVTNAVKHFKFERRGKKRIHQKPTMGEIKHYRWWLMKELDFVAPKLVVALGATAATALVGKAVSISALRGEVTFGSVSGYVTVHPSYLLRLPDAEKREAAYKDFVADLTRIRQLLAA